MLLMGLVLVQLMVLGMVYIVILLFMHLTQYQVQQQELIRYTIVQIMVLQLFMETTLTEQILLD